MPVKFAAVCGNAYKSFKRSRQLGLHNIFSVTQRITKETSLINLKLIKACEYLVSYSTFSFKYSLALKIIWCLKNCCGRYLLERFIHSVLSNPATKSAQLSSKCKQRKRWIHLTRWHRFIRVWFHFFGRFRLRFRFR